MFIYIHDIDTNNKHIPRNIFEMSSDFCMAGWPSGLRRQTQVRTCLQSRYANSGPQQRAWVQIPLLTNIFSSFLFLQTPVDVFIFGFGLISVLISRK